MVKEILGRSWLTVEPPRHYAWENENGLLSLSAGGIDHAELFNQYTRICVSCAYDGSWLGF